MSPLLETRLAIYLALLRMEVIAYLNGLENAPYWVQYVFKYQEPGSSSLPETPRVDFRGVLSSRLGPYLSDDIAEALVRFTCIITIHGVPNHTKRADSTCFFFSFFFFQLLLESTLTKPEEATLLFEYPDGESLAIAVPYPSS